MRRRVLLATIAAVAAAVILLGVPLGIFGARYVIDTEAQRLSDRLDRLISSVQVAQDAERPVSDVALQRAVQGREGDIKAFVSVTLPDGTLFEAGDRVEGPVMEVGGQTDSLASVTLTASSWDAWIKAAYVVTLVAIVGVVAILAGVAIAMWQANRLSAPLVYLAASAEQIASGQVRPRLEPSGVEEIDLVAAELARTSDRLAARLAAERQFTSDASHQLRTPLTALTMRLEEIQAASQDPDVQEEARISLEQVERLVTVVDDLLAASRRSQGGTTEPVRLRDVVVQQEEEWGPTFAREGRRLVLDVPADQRVLATPGALAQVLATLLENSLRHGGGTTTVRSRPSGTTGAVRVEVADEGPGVPDDIAGKVFERGMTSGAGTGLGLALARDLASADGGRLELAQRRPAVFALFLAGVPKALDPRVVLPPGTTISSRGRRARRSTGT
ncbi:histidine kinase [Xylanimonas cellulosilytica DSM 15894]|uniref:Signal transduction histidine-protein kinase/phosphatase MprB n=1 Tax=Xylanimonas cellulosilytica (strain DSM 15894 / JCM 12276 / CECT 5975 / KCTC 9989 / LMG 20990 / NBRC 107835 / XIL07) TaxID=446471 RepID=D1BX44_XYLCX|nr:ATP-binding protein [Xylanimonas cellulosilytica]ACZ31612.1 histidine kinase [Xylanimonas cellulosilytica DSM 15894]